MNNSRILAIDVGSGTQDILVWEPGIAPENCPKMILPSSTTIVARKVFEATAKGLPIFLTGKTMGGGPSTRAVKKHLKKGYPVYSLAEPALTFNDDLEKVRAMGIQVVEGPPEVEPRVEILMADVDMEAIGWVLKKFHIAKPDMVAIAVQDHGFSVKQSNRAVRFKQWQELLESGRPLADMIFQRPPEHLTRMRAVVETVPGAWVMDTGPAAILGALKDPWAASRLGEGLVVINIGNEHVLASLLKGEKVWGIYEHHTSLLDLQKLKDHMERFRQARLTNKEVFDDRGHGCAVLEGAGEAGPFPHTAITGPRRDEFGGLEGHRASPFGDMMLTGCFGLIEAVTWKISQKT